MHNSPPTPVFQWTPAYAVGIEQIDREHQWLFAAVEQMHQAMLAGKGKGSVRSLLSRLVNYTCDHFAHEEQFMARIDYPGLAEHCRQHEALRANVRSLEARVAAGEITLTIEVTQFLIDWLKQHTTSSDRRVAEYFLASGRSC